MPTWLDGCLMVVGCAALLCLGADGGAVVRESARQLPVAYDVDVVVVGGSTGAVAAAATAARDGATVFLAAPRLHLGEDMVSTLRLWLEPGETPQTPLARRVFAGGSRDVPPSVPFTYEADLPSVGAHRDSTPPSKLADGHASNPQEESVQYNGDVTLVATLAEPQRLEAAQILVFHQRDFQVGRVTISTSDDGRQWKQVAVVRNPHPPQQDRRAAALALSAPVKATTRHVRFAVKRAEGATRLLIGEIALTRAEAVAGREPGRVVVEPLHVERVLDRALLDAGVRFLFGCTATDVLRDAAGRPCGIVMANRAGRQAVVARVIVDATDRAAVARLAGATCSGFQPGEHAFQRVVIGGEPRSGKGVRARRTGLSFEARARKDRKGPAERRAWEVIAYDLRLPLRDGGFASRAEAEQRARDLTNGPQQVLAADRLFAVPPDSVVGRAAFRGAWQGVEHLPLDAFRPKGVRHLLVLGGCADIAREDAATLLRPITLMAMGRRIGAAAAAQAKALPRPREPHVAGPPPPEAAGDVREGLGGVRPVQHLPTVPQAARALPVLGACDVVVIGGGTSGAPAGIAAARQGVKTLVVEYQHALGGVGTLGLIGRYHRGHRVGFTAEVDKAIGATARGWNVLRKAEWWRRELRKAGADLWFGCLGCGAFVENGRVRGAVVATPEGRGVVLAKVVIDATGNADVAAAAGAPCLYTDGSTVAVQGTGLPVHNLGANYTNTDFTITDETDMVDVWQLLVYARQRYARGFDLGRLIDTRERRRVAGDFTLSLLDQINGRTYPDTIARCISNLDTHGYTINPYLTLRHPKTVECYVPYRCLLPKGLDGLLVIGLGLSAQRDAVPFVRMQADLQNLGYAAGCAAAMAAKANVGTREIDIRKLQAHLVETGNLPAEVVEHEDSYPLPPERIEQAVLAIPKGYEGAAVVLSHREQALPLLRKAYQVAPNAKAKLAYAHVLAVLGDATGVGTLIEAVEAARDLGDGYEYRGMGHDNSRRRMSQTDSLIQALGRTRDRRATPAILRKLALLGPEAPFSHHYHIATALEYLADPAAARPLADLLSKPGMSGHAIQTVSQAIEREQPPLGNATRLLSFREIVLARALHRCGDHNGVARRILTAYTRDLRGHFARHAAAVLRAGSAVRSARP